MATTKTSSKSSEFTVTLETGGEIFTGNGKTILEAIENIPTDYTKIKYKGIFKATQGDKKAERFMYTASLKKVFANKLRRVYLADNLNYMLS